tara:strand:- start:9 stop:815 length:807 start_codon:yes stop_codon:yes gene_type:complete
VFCYEQVRLAGWIAFSSEEVLHSLQSLHCVHARQYHITQRRRHNWYLRQFLESDDTQQVEITKSTMMSEVLTRIWSTAVNAWYLSTQDMTIGLEAESNRHLYLAIQADHHALTQRMLEETSGNRNRFKLREFDRQCQRWTDLLLAYMGLLPGSQAFGYRRERIDNHIEELQYQMESGQAQAARKFTNLSLKQAFHKSQQPRLTDLETIYDLNSRYATTIISSLEGHLVQIPDQWQSYWQPRVVQDITLAERLIRQWQHVERGDQYFWN